MIHTAAERGDPTGRICCIQCCPVAEQLQDMVSKCADKHLSISEKKEIFLQAGKRKGRIRMGVGLLADGGWWLDLDLD